MLTGRDIPTRCWADGLPPANLETTVPGVFAAGDIRAGSMKRVAAASGEGASVVPLVHALARPGRLRRVRAGRSKGWRLRPIVALTGGTPHGEPLSPSERRPREFL